MLNMNGFELDTRYTINIQEEMIDCEHTGGVDLEAKEAVVGGL